MTFFHCLLFGCVLGVSSSSIGTWTTIASMPAGSSYAVSAALVVGKLVVVASETATSILDTGTGQWTLAPPAPTLRSHYAGGASVYGGIYVIGGAPAPAPTTAVSLVEHYTWASGTWTTGTSMPTARYSCSGASDLETIWVFGSQATGTKVVEVYDIGADSWTTLPSQSPVGLGRAGTSFFEGLVYVTCITYLFSLHPDTATWSTKSSIPKSRANIFDMFECFRSHCYLAGVGHPTADTYKDVHSYSTLADTWTTLNYTPMVFYAAALAITPIGYMVVAGNYLTGTETHAYDGFVLAGSTGDPLFYSFRGSEVHLSLRTAVFNFLTTPTVVVNALVEEFPALPPEENTLVTTLGIVAEFDGCLILFYCSVAEFPGGFCSAKVAQCVNQNAVINLDQFLTTLSHGYRVTVGNFSIEVELEHQTLELLLPEGTQTMNSTFINVWLHPLPPHLVVPSVFAGVLGDLCTSGLARVLKTLALDAYTVDEGCVFATQVSSTHGIFSAVGTQLALGEC